MSCEDALSGETCFIFNKTICVYNLDIHFPYGLPHNPKVTNYLSCRCQVVSVCDSSESHCINYGEVQGSTLGPILFQVYISITKINLRGKISLFADETLIYISGNNWELREKGSGT